MRSHPSLAGALVVLAILGASCARDAAGPYRGRDVVLISIETLRRDHVGAYGSPWGLTPNIDEIAESSIVVDGYVAAPWTRANVASMLTGVAPRRHGAVMEDTAAPLPQSVTTLAEILSDAGYDTLGVVTNPNLYRELGFDQGFQTYDQRLTLARDLNTFALEWLKRRESERPAFVFMHYNEPHDAHYQTPVYSGVGSDSIGGAREWRYVSDGEFAAALERYRQQIRLLDHHVGEFVRQVDEMLEDPLIVITSDHGEEWLDHGNTFHGSTLYEELVAVPLLLRLPDATPKRWEQPFSHLNLLPTFCEWLGVTCPADLDGLSLHRAILGKQPFPAEVYVETELDASLESIIRDGFKLIRSRDSDEIELYDLKNDPGETLDLSASRPQAVQRLTARLNSVTQAIEERAGRAPAVEIDLPSAEEQERLTAQLRSLGYVGGSPSGDGASGNVDNPGLTAGKWPFRRRPWSELLREHELLSASRDGWFETDWLRAPRPPYLLRSMGTGQDSLSFEREFQTAYLLFAPMGDRGVIEVSLNGRLWDRVELREIAANTVVVPLHTEQYGSHEVHVRALPSDTPGQRYPGGRVIFDGALIRREDAPPLSRLAGVRGKLRLGDAILRHEFGKPSFLEADAASGIYTVGLPYHASTFELTAGSSLRIGADEPMGGVSLTYRAVTNELDVEAVPMEDVVLPRHLRIFGPERAPRVNVDGSVVRSISRITERGRTGFAVELVP